MRDMIDNYPKWKLKLWNYLIRKRPMWCYTYADNNIVRHKILGIKIDNISRAGDIKMYKKTGIPEPINIPPMPIKKPPLGLTPRNIWLSKRLFDVKEAIKRYLDADCPIPDRWIKEYNELVNLLEKYEL